MFLSPHNVARVEERLGHLAYVATGHRQPSLKRGLGYRLANGCRTRNFTIVGIVHHIAMADYLGQYP